MLDHQRNSPVTKALLQIEARLAGGPAGDSEPRSKLTRVFANLIKG
jgi:hypothetical protein